MMKINWRALAPLVVGALLFLAASSSGPVLAQTSDNALSPEAEQAMRYGLAAAKQQEWELAIKYYEKVREAAPYAPEVLFNLALAYNKAGGRELIAIAWFRAYLAAAPGAANAEQVRERIIELKVKVEAGIAKLIAKAKEAADQVDVDQIQRKSGYEHLLVHIVIAQAEAGDFAGATATAARIPNDSSKLNAYENIAEAQAKVGDIAGAKATVARNPDNYGKWWTYLYIAKAQGKAGDIDGARQSIALAKEDAADDSNANRRIAAAEAEAGFIGSALNTAAQISNDSDRSDAYGSIAYAQVHAGDIAGAENTIARISDDDRFSTRYTIARIQAQAGDLAGAKQTIARNPDKWGKSSIYQYIAMAQVKAGNIAGARQSIALAEKAVKSLISSSGQPTKSEIYLYIADAQTRAGDRGVASKPHVRYFEINRLADKVKYGLDRPHFQDMQGFIRSLTTEQPREVIFRLAQAAQDQARALKGL